MKMDPPPCLKLQFGRVNQVSEETPAYSMLEDLPPVCNSNVEVRSVGVVQRNGSRS